LSTTIVTNIPYLIRPPVKTSSSYIQFGFDSSGYILPLPLLQIDAKQDQENSSSHFLENNVLCSPTINYRFGNHQTLVPHRRWY